MSTKTADDFFFTFHFPFSCLYNSYGFFFVLPEDV